MVKNKKINNAFLVKRLAADILNCGRRKVWIDPLNMTKLTNNTRREVRNLISSRTIIKKPNVVHSRFRARERKEAIRKGRHKGLGKRKGTANARNSTKTMWIRRIRILRRLIKKYRDLYKRIKGNQFKNKNVLIEFVHKEISERKSLAAAAEVARERRVKNADKKAKKRQVKGELEDKNQEEYRLALRELKARKE